MAAGGKSNDKPGGTETGPDYPDPPITEGA